MHSTISTIGAFLCASTVFCHGSLPAFADKPEPDNKPDCGIAFMIDGSSSVFNNKNLMQPDETLRHLAAALNNRSIRSILADKGVCTLSVTGFGDGLQVYVSPRKVNFGNTSEIAEEMVGFSNKSNEIKIHSRTDVNYATEYAKRLLNESVAQDGEKFVIFVTDDDRGSRTYNNTKDLERESRAGTQFSTFMLKMPLPESFTFGSSTTSFSTFNSQEREIPPEAVKAGMCSRVVDLNGRQNQQEKITEGLAHMLTCGVS